MVEKVAFDVCQKTVANPMLGKFQDDSISLEPFTFSPAEFALDNGEPST